jgi:hypothetical protein
VIVLRRPFDFYFGWFLFVAMAVMDAVVLVRSEPSVEVKVWGGEIVFLAATWLIWLVTAHPKTVLTPSRLVVVNWFVRHDIPWSLVGEVSVEDGEARISLRDGYVIRPTTGGSSLVSAIRGNRRQRELQALIETWRTSADLNEGAQRTRRVDLFPIPSLVVALVIFAYNFFSPNWFHAYW